MREPVSGHEVVKKKRDCNNLEKETVVLCVAHWHHDLKYRLLYSNYA